MFLCIHIIRDAQLVNPQQVVNQDRSHLSLLSVSYAIPEQRYATAEGDIDTAHSGNRAHDLGRQLH